MRFWELCCFIVSFYDEMGNCVSKEFDDFNDAVEYSNSYSHMTEVNIFKLERLII